MEHKFFSDHLREYLKENESKLIEGLSEIVAQPSVSSTGEGVSKCCELIVKKMRSEERRVGTDLSNRATFSDYWKNWRRSFKKDSFDICSL